MLLAAWLVGASPWYMENLDTTAIVGVYASFSEDQSRGTGFVVDKGVVATCSHVVFPRRPDHRVEGLTLINSRGDTVPVLGILATDPKNDICLISIADTSLKPLALGSRSMGRFFGVVVPYNPGNENLMRPLRLEFLREEVWSDGIRNMVVSAGPVPGYSGSPVFSDLIYGGKRYVVGMIVAVGDRDVSFAVEPEPIRLLLEKARDRKPVSLARAYETYRQSPAGLREMARCSWAAGDFQAAENCYLLSLQRDPSNPTTHEEYASLLWSLARARNDASLLTRAEEHYRQAMKLKDDPRLHELVAFIYLETKRFQEAGEELSWAASLYEKKGQKAKADSLRFQMKVVSSWGELDE